MDTQPLGSFGRDWLELREPHDRAARDATAAMTESWATAVRRAVSARQVSGSLPSKPGTSGTPLAHGTPGPPRKSVPTSTSETPETPEMQATPALRIMDIGCGTGATLRYLAPRLGGTQHWRVWDHDAALLQAWPAAMSDWAQREGHVVESSSAPAAASASPPGSQTLRINGHTCFSATVERHRIDLAQHLHQLSFAQTDLLCATALLDLVSAHWLADLIDRARKSDVALSLALIVDGRIEWDPPINGDALVAQAFADHQDRDKGFGPALGSHAPTITCQLLDEAGYDVQQARSDWVLQGEHGAALQLALIDGMATAACEQQPADATTIGRWRIERTAAVGRSCLRIGHVDIVAIPRQLS